VTPKVGANIGAITGILLREDPLSPGILDVLFRKYLYDVSLFLSVRDSIYNESRVRFLWYAL
jgi:hypothetical protein